MPFVQAGLNKRVFKPVCTTPGLPRMPVQTTSKNDNHPAETKVLQTHRSPGRRDASYPKGYATPDVVVGAAPRGIYSDWAYGADSAATLHSTIVNAGRSQ